MRPLRFAQNPAVVLLVTLFVVACAPRPAYREAEITEPDGGPDMPDPQPALPEDAAPPPDPTADAMVGPPPTDAPADGALSPPPISDGGGEPAPAGKAALLVVSNPATVAADDTKIKARLEAKGFTVTLGDDDGPPAQAEGMRLVVL